MLQSKVVAQRNQRDFLLQAVEQEPAQEGEHSPRSPFPKDQPVVAVAPPGQKQVPAPMEGEQQRREPAAVLRKRHHTEEQKGAMLGRERRH